MAVVASILIDQSTTEAQYSKREINPTWHALIQSETDHTFLDFTLSAWYKLTKYLTTPDSSYTDNKCDRIDMLGLMDMDKIVEHILEAVAIKPKQTLQEVVGYLQRYMPHPDPLDRVKTAAEILAVCENRGSLYWIRGNGPRRAHTVVIDKPVWVRIHPNISDTIDWINTTVFNPPLVAKPLKATNDNCGYHTIREPSILGFETQHDGCISLDVLDMLNGIKWVIDPHVLAEQEISNKPLDTRDKREAFNDQIRDSKELYAMYQDKPFWFVWQYDSRGRVYTHGYHIAFQSYEYKKALLSFDKYEYLD